jgi:hypothetical protein
MTKMTAAVLAGVGLIGLGLIGLAGVSVPAAANEAAVAAQPRFRAHGINRPLNYRFPVLPRNHSFNARTHRHGWRHRHHHHRFVGLPVLSGPAVIYQNGEIELPDDNDITGALPPPIVQPVIHRLGVSGACDLQRVNVRGERGRTTVNVWRC